VLTATFNSYGNRQISTPYKINTPEPIEKKFGTVHYVREGTPYTKFGTNSPTGSFWANGWNIAKNIFIYLYLFFWGTHTGQTRGWICTHDSTKDVKSCKDVPFGGYKTRHGVLQDCPRARGQLEDPKSWPWPLTVLALASKWSGLGLGLGLDASASSHRSVINVLIL